MMLGQGNISFKGLQTPSGAPFAAGSADNGLSVDPVTGRIVLGNDTAGILAALLNDREIPMNTHNILLTESALPTTRTILNGGSVSTSEDISGYSAQLNSNGFLLAIGDSAGVPSSPGGRVRMQDLFVPGGAEWSIGNANGALIAIEPNTLNRYLELDFLNFQRYLFGDIDGSLNGTRLELFDGVPNAALRTTAGNMLLLDQSTGSYKLGDIDTTQNATLFAIDDANQVAAIEGGAFTGLVTDFATGRYEFGNISGGSQTRLDIDDALLLIDAKVGANNMLHLDQASALYEIGDVDAANNSTKIRIDDTSQDIAFIATGGISTSDPGAGQGQWLLGKVQAGAVALDAANYVETLIDGATVKLLKAA